MTIEEQRLRNESARKEIARINEECGIRFNFIAKQLGMKYHSFAGWKGSVYQFGQNRLEVVESFIGKYKKLK